MTKKVHFNLLTDYQCLDNFENRETSNNFISKKILNRISNIQNEVCSKGFQGNIVLKNKLKPVLRIHMKWREMLFE